MVASKAKVFISCGQASPEERQTASEVSALFSKLGFEPYVAIYEQSLRGLKENIFAHLQSSEYFLFINFRREGLIGPDGQAHHRGSLFTNQELALASFLDIPIIALQEVGVKLNDGLLGFLQANPVIFSDRNQLGGFIEAQIKLQNWKADWKNRLIFKRDPNQYDDIGGPEIKDGRKIKDFSYRIYHIGVINLHHSKPAVNCTVQLERAIDKNTGKEILLDEAFDFKWAGIKQVSAIISPSVKRYFDACLFWPENPSEIDFSLATNYNNHKERFRARFKGRFDLELTFLVMAENFPSSRGVFRLRHGKQLTDVSLEQLS